MATKHAHLAKVVCHGVVDIVGDRARADGQLGRTIAGAHVLADRADGPRSRSPKRSSWSPDNAHAIRPRRLPSVASATSADVAHDLLEGFVAGHEVGLGVDLHDDRARRVGGDADQAFSGRCGPTSCRPWKCPSCAASPTASSRLPLVLGERGFTIPSCQRRSCRGVV